MKTRLRILSAIAAVVLLVPGVPRAEFPQTRESGVIGLSLGFGNAGADLTTVAAVDRRNGFSGSFRLGFVVNPSFTGAFEATGWSTVDGSDQWTFALLAGAVTWFPSPQKGYFLRGGLGWGATTVVRDRDLPTERRFQDRSGLGVLLGAGYEFRISKQVSFGPDVQWVYINSQGDLTTTADFLSFLIDLNYHY